MEIGIHFDVREPTERCLQVSLEGLVPLDTPLQPTVAGCV
jgi:hypothetical protein